MSSGFSSSSLTSGTFQTGAAIGSDREADAYSSSKISLGDLNGKIAKHDPKLMVLGPSEAFSTETGAAFRPTASSSSLSDKAMPISGNPFQHASKSPMAYGGSGSSSSNTAQAAQRERADANTETFDTIRRSPLEDATDPQIACTTPTKCSAQNPGAAAQRAQEFAKYKDKNLLRDSDAMVTADGSSSDSDAPSPFTTAAAAAAANKNVPFWTQDPNILTSSRYGTEFFPTENMSLSRKLNAMTRLLIVLTLVGYFMTRRIHILFLGLLSISFVFMMYQYQVTYYKAVHGGGQEGFAATEGPDANPGDWVWEAKKKVQPGLAQKQLFDEPTSRNPFSNVLVTDYVSNPDKKPAPPAGNPLVAETIHEKVKDMIREMHPDEPDLVDRMYQSKDDQLAFDQSLRQFYSMPNTQIPNDQKALTDFLYGGMVSCKEGNAFACARNMPRHRL